MESPCRRRRHHKHKHGRPKITHLDKLKILLNKSNLYANAILHLTTEAERRRQARCGKKNLTSNQIKKLRTNANNRFKTITKKNYKRWHNIYPKDKKFNLYQYQNVVFLMDDLIDDVCLKMKTGDDHEYPLFSTPVKNQTSDLPDPFTMTPFDVTKATKRAKRNICRSMAVQSPPRKLMKLFLDSSNNDSDNDKDITIDEIMNNMLSMVENFLELEQFDYDEHILKLSAEKEKKKQTFDENMDSVIDRILLSINSDGNHDSSKDMDTGVEMDFILQSLDDKALETFSQESLRQFEENVLLPLDNGGTISSDVQDNNGKPEALSDMKCEASSPKTEENKSVNRVISSKLKRGVIKDEAAVHYDDIKTQTVITQSATDLQSNSPLIKENSESSPILNTGNKICNMGGKEEVILLKEQDSPTTSFKGDAVCKEQMDSQPSLYENDGCYTTDAERLSSKVEEILSQEEATSQSSNSQSSVRVPCPVCDAEILESKMNQHLDICLSGVSRKKSLRRSVSSPKISKPGRKKSGRGKSSNVLKSNTEKNSKRKISALEEHTARLNKSFMEKFVTKMEDTSSEIDAGSECDNDSITGSSASDTKPESEASTSSEHVTRSGSRRSSRHAKATNQNDSSTKEMTAIEEHAAQMNQSFMEKYVTNNQDKDTGSELDTGSEIDDKSTAASSISDLKYDEDACSSITSLDSSNSAPTTEHEQQELAMYALGDNTSMRDEMTDSDSDDSSSSDIEFEVPDTLRRSSRSTANKRSYKEIEASSSDSDDSDDEDGSDNDDGKDSVDKNDDKSDEVKIGSRIIVKWPDDKGEKIKTYKAKVLNMKTDAEGVSTYLVHYLGWEKNFDEWINEDDVICKASLKQGRETLSVIDEAKLLKEKFYLPNWNELKAMDVDRIVEKDGVRYFRGVPVTFDQPKLLTGGRLRDYQIAGFNWLHTLFCCAENGILADEMGLGKTLQCIAAICSVIEKKLAGPFLVIAPMSTLENWFNEFKKFAPKLPLLMYHGTTEERATLSLCISQRDPHLKVYPVVITSYDVFMRDHGGLQVEMWSYLILDEGHRVKNMKCKLLRLLNDVQVQSKILLTGTPLQNSLSELWSLLNFLLPELFDDLDTFQSWFNFNALQQDQSLLAMAHKIITPFILRRMKADVSVEIASKCEVIIYARLSAKQQEMYRATVDKTIMRFLKHNEASLEKIFYDQVELAKAIDLDCAKNTVTRSKKKTDLNTSSSDDSYRDEETVVNVTLSNVMMMLRKCSNHSYLVEYPLLPGTDILRIDEELITSSGKLSVLDQLLPCLKSKGHKVLLFSQMTMMLDILEDYCKMKHYNCVRIDGTTGRNDRTENIESFNNDPNVFIFLLSTRAGGLGINLTAADTVIIYDSDWNPQCDKQAQDRCHRIGQTKPVIIYRLVTPGTIDQEMVERANKKKVFEELIMHKEMFKGSLEKDLKNSLLNPRELLHHLKAIDNNNKQSGSDSNILPQETLEKLLDREYIKQCIDDNSYLEINEMDGKGVYEILK